MPPFQSEHEICHHPSSLEISTLPGYPLIETTDLEGLYNFMKRDLWARDLEAISGKLWWMSKVDSSNISPLHRQSVKQRHIIVTEEPKLHLTWLGDRIYIKPIPRYLLSYQFWAEYLDTTKPGKHSPTSGDIRALRSSALGFLRTYFHLIQYESDFRVGQLPELLLIPPDVSWEQFCRFSASLQHIRDEDVSGRYHFGEIRLSRLNFYAPILLRKRNYHRIHHQYNEYFGRFYGPLLVTLTIVSVVLSSMQLAAACIQASTAEELVEFRWGPVRFLWFSLGTMYLMLLVVVGFGFIWASKIGCEWRTAIADWRRFQQVLERRENVISP